MKDCQTEGCCGSSSVSRRDLMRAAGAAAGAAYLGGGSLVWAEPGQSFEDLIPSDKKLDPAWIRLLYERGEPETFHGDELKYIGMPVGGICCGQLYVGGDGRLWLWDIFRAQYQSDYKGMSHGVHYAHPPTPQDMGKNTAYEVAQGFAVRIKTKDGEQVRTLDQQGFSDVRFRGEYPIARVSYRDPTSPVEVDLEAFSPFIPLDAQRSGMPAVVMSLTCRNRTQADMQIDLAGWLQNSVFPTVDQADHGQRINEVRAHDDRITLHMTSQSTHESLRHEHGFGSMALTMLQSSQVETALHSASVGGKINDTQAVFAALQSVDVHDESPQLKAETSMEVKPIGALGASLTLKPGESRTVNFVISWWFPFHVDVAGEFASITNADKMARYYNEFFSSAEEAADHIVENFDELTGLTRRWNQTWYDSTLPYWFLDRSFVTINTLATQTCHRFENGRFWGWEGVTCCPGTCQHVWNYAQAMARIFPELERDLRERVDYGLSFQPSGELWYRGEAGRHIAHDGQAGTILRAYREHQMSADIGFLKRNWLKIKKSIQFLMREDKDHDGLLEGRQYNTLDSAWYGPMAWISSMYLAALAAGEQMAGEMDDLVFAKQCAMLIGRGRKNIVDRLFDGEYFVHETDLNRSEATNTNKGCHIDQVFGQSFAWQVGLPRIAPKTQTESALQSLWQYNFTPDIGPYRENSPIKGGRWYALAGEGGLLMCTWPKGGGEQAPGTKPAFPFAVGYFNECMTGFEYQVAGHMIHEGQPGSDLVEKGLAIVRTIHDRYHASRRNPYNEVECSDHYSRAMASYGVFLAVCGYEYHGPKGHLGFAPRLTPENFKAPFTAAEGWGTFSQRIDGRTMKASVEIKMGKLAIQTLALSSKQKVVGVAVNGKSARFTQKQDRVLITLADRTMLSADQSLTVRLAF